MKKFLAFTMVAVLLVCAGGCGLFPVPAASSAVGTPTGTVPAATSPSSAPESTPLPTVAPTATLTDTPTEAPTEEPTASPSPSDDMIFPHSDSELIPWKDLMTLDAKKLDLARNEIFAREGYPFTKEYYTEYFSKFSWYTVDPDFSQSKFNEIELANIHLIQAAEKAVGGQLFDVSSGLQLDYDQDGDLETLTFSTPDESHMKVVLKDGGGNTVWNVECDTPIKKVYLGDIAVSDGILDIFVGDAGFSDNYTLNVAGIQNGKFLSRGKLPGAVPTGNDKSTFKLNGKGQISTRDRIDTVGTDFFMVQYKLNTSGKLVFYPLASYNFISYSPGQYTVTTKVDLTLKKKNSSSSETAFVVPAGTKVTLLSTDTKKWVKVKAPAGVAWLELAERLKVKDPYIDTWDAFDGLLLAG